MLPSEAVSALRFLHHLHDTDGTELHSPGHPKVETRINGADLVAPDMGKLVSVAEALQRVQEATGTPFALPKSWTHQDAQMLYFCDRLLTNGSVTWQPPSAAAATVVAAAIPGVAAFGPFPRINIKGQSAGLAEVPVTGHLVKLPGEVRLDLAGMVVTNLRQLVAAAGTEPPWTPLRMHLAADQSTHAIFYLAAEETV